MVSAPKLDSSTVLNIKNKKMADWSQALPILFQNIKNAFPYKEIRVYEQGLRFRLGNPTTDLIKPHYYWHWPIIGAIEKVDCRYDEFEFGNLNVFTKDKQSLTISAAIGYKVTSARKYLTEVKEFKIDADKIAKRHLSRSARRYNLDEILFDGFEENNPIPVERELVTSATSTYDESSSKSSEGHQEGNGSPEIPKDTNLYDLFQERNMSRLERSVFESLRTRFSDFGVNVIAVGLTDIAQSIPIRLYGDYAQDI